MNTEPMTNLDLACAKAGRQLAARPSKELEKLVTAALGVLEEQGVYALFLYLESHRNSLSNDVSNSLEGLLRKLPGRVVLLPDGDNVFDRLHKLSRDLDNLLLARDLLRRTLVYARYHARIREDAEETP